MKKLVLTIIWLAVGALVAHFVIEWHEGKLHGFKPDAGIVKECCAQGYYPGVECMENLDEIDWVNKPLEGWSAILAVPSYGPIDPACQKGVRVAMMSASKYGLAWEADASPDKCGWGHGRNMVAQSILSFPECNGIMWIDSDMVIEPKSIAKLLSTARRNNAEFVTGVYHQRGGYFTPVFYHWSKVSRG